MSKASHKAETSDTEVPVSNELTDQEKLKCFIISPFGSDDTDIRKKAKGLIEAVIKPVLNDLNFVSISSLDISNPGSISNEVITRLMDDDLVIANLTSLNPNVMYELAVRHAIRKPVVSLVEKGTDLPFDIAQERAVQYTDDMLGVYDLKPMLTAAVVASLKDKEVDNPIYRAIQQKAIIQQNDVKVGSLNDLILRKFDELEQRVSSLNIVSATSEYRKPDFNNVAVFKTDEEMERVILNDMLRSAKYTYLTNDKTGEINVYFPTYEEKRNFCRLFLAITNNKGHVREHSDNV